MNKWNNMDNYRSELKAFENKQMILSGKNKIDNSK